MIIYRGQIGFCGGVNRAIEIAKKNRKDDKQIYTLGKIIHNNMVINSLQESGIVPIYDKNMLNSGDTIIINAHGTGKDSFDKLKSKNINVIDATCPFVKKIHKTVEEYSKSGFEIIILGEKDHIEIEGISGWCKKFQIVNNCEEIDFNNSEKFLIVSQTTFPVERYGKIKENIEFFSNKLNKIVVFFDSICYTTVERQNEAEMIAKKSQMVLVIGDKESSNTRKLMNIAKKFCQEVRFISNETEAKSVQIKNIAKLGILSGASTPIELITEVTNIMQEKSNNDIIVEDSVATTEPKEAKEAEKAETKEVKKEKKELTMAEGMRKYRPKTYREGMRLTARVVSTDYNGISVALENAGKNDSGFISKEQAEIDGSYDQNNYKPGDILDVVIIPKDPGGSKSNINLSKKAFDAIKIDDEKVKDILAGEEFSLSHFQEIKGGLLGKIGTYTIFVPASQIRLGYVKNLADYTNKKLRLKALPPREEELNEEDESKRARNPKRIVASQKIILEDEKKEREDEFWDSIPVGSVVNGKVKRFAAFGAFVNLKFMDALVHNSELSWSKKRINSADEILELNKNYDFQVLSTDRENGKISLGYKQLQPKPYEIALTKYPVGSVVKGKVVRIVKFGAFVELEPGIDGLVHVSQINRNYVKNAEEVLKEGEEVEVKVISFENDKITLSIKDTLPVEEKVQEITDQELKEETIARNDKFKKKLEKMESYEKKERKPKMDTDEMREYKSSSTVATFADIFKQLDK